MSQFFEVKIKHTLINAKNAYEIVKAQYLVEAVSYTEAEVRMAEYMERNWKGDSYEILKISQSKVQYTDIAPEDRFAEGTDLYYFKVKANVLMEIEGKAKPKKVALFALVECDSPETSTERINDILAVDGAEVVKIEKTKFDDIIATPEE